MSSNVALAVSTEELSFVILINSGTVILSVDVASSEAAANTAGLISMSASAAGSNFTIFLIG